MFVSTTAPAILALVSAALALPSSVPMALFEAVDSAPKGWNMDGAAAKDEVIELRIHLAKQNVAQFQELALNIATPGHEQYGKHLTVEQIDAIVAPSAKSMDLVFQWLGNYSLADGAVLNPRKNIVRVNTTISQAETLMGAEYNTYTNAETGKKASRTLNVHIPKVLIGHIDVIQPTTFFGFKKLIPYVRPKSEISPLVTYTTPTTLASLYKFNGISALTNGIMGIAGFIGQWPSKTDLTTFMRSFTISGFGNSAQTYTCTTVNGGSCPTNPTGNNIGIEANLDVQYARAITSDIPNVFYSTGGNDDDIYEYLSEYILGLSAAQRPNIISVSYGGDESEVALSVADATCNLFSELGSAGVSIVFASGDSGVGDSCTINGKNAYQPDFPGGCPWVTMVGGTTGTTSESAWVDGGGGFSNYFGRPSWQNTAVTSWLSTNKDGNTAYYNSSGRAYPDVAAGATYFEIVYGGSVGAVDGTSCAAPTFSSVIQLVNSNRIAQGKAALGFLNPWLYSTASTALNDITSGKIGGCSTISNAGFTAVSGWDPATGWGSPNYPKLLSAGLAV
ncbi:peptidase S8/S53 domain-containing protein [Xylariaceae sp. FL1651]|nr:peptidase S8/S53 domain-containing protein [Xylariaceae sp. FL1651]